MTPKVSVVVPVFNPGRHIDALIDSLRRQSMAPSDFEAVFVDDGSTDGTGERLDRLARDVPNFRVVHISNSGWPGRPRNAGIEAARGEYVQLVDNDDRLGDEALERLYAYAISNHADVVIGREVRTSGWVISPGLFLRDRPRATLEDDPLLTSLVPHKMFRRAFLLEHGIRFPERTDVLEDHAFVIDAYLKARVISVLASYTCYYWQPRSDRTNAGAQSIGRDFTDTLDAIERETEPGPFRDKLLAHWLDRKVLIRVAGGWREQPEDAARRILDRQHELVCERFPATVDQHLRGFTRVRSALLRARDFDSLRALASFQEGIRSELAVDGVRIDDNEIVVALAGRFVDADAAPIVLEERGERLLWQPPVDVGAHLPEDVLDFTHAYGATTATVIARGRSSHETYVLPSQMVLPATANGQRALGAAVEARLVPDISVTGRDRPEVWDIEIRVVACGLVTRRRVPAPTGAVAAAPVAPAVTRPRLRVAFATERRTLALVDDDVVALARSAPPDESRARLHASSGGVQLVLPLRRLDLEGERELGSLRLTAKADGAVAMLPLTVAGSRSADAAYVAATLTDPGTSGEMRVACGVWRVAISNGLGARAVDLELTIERGRLTLRHRDGRELSHVDHDGPLLRQAATYRRRARLARRIARRTLAALAPR